MAAALHVRTVLAVGLVFIATQRARAIEPLVTNYGLGNLLHPLQEPANVPTCDAPKDHIYVFAINGVNPLCQGNFNGFCNYLKKLGYCHTYFGQLYTWFGWANRIRQLRRCDPEAKIVVIGFSAGVYVAKKIANDLARDGTRVDLLIYLVGDMLTNSPSNFPPNVGRVLNIRAKGLILTGGDLFLSGVDIEGARNCKLECRHILVPSRCETLTVVAEEMAALTCGTGSAPPPVGPAELLTPPGK